MMYHKRLGVVSQVRSGAVGCGAARWCGAVQPGVGHIVFFVGTHEWTVLDAVYTEGRGVRANYAG